MSFQKFPPSVKSTRTSIAFPFNNRMLMFLCELHFFEMKNKSFINGYDSQFWGVESEMERWLIIMRIISVEKLSFTL